MTHNHFQAVRFGISATSVQPLILACSCLQEKGRELQVSAIAHTTTYGAMGVAPGSAKREPALSTFLRTRGCGVLLYYRDFYVLQYSMKKINVTNKKFVLIDEDDYPKVKNFQWSIKKCRIAEYAVTYINRKTIRMHHLIIPRVEGLVTDHINGNGLDNRKCNLRLCTPAQNRLNVTAYCNNKSGFKGVFKDKERGGWIARIRKDGKTFYLGRFKTAEDASRAYIKKSKKLHGEFSYYKRNA